MEVESTESPKKKLVREAYFSAAQVEVVKWNSFQEREIELEMGDDYILDLKSNKDEWLIPVKKLN